MRNQQTPVSDPGRHGHYVALDALRGVAALVVVVSHTHRFLGGLPAPGSSYLSVDLFYLLSGFVLAGAYGTRLAQGMPVREFLKARLIRLYPLYLLAFAIGLVRGLFKMGAGATAAAPDQFALAAALELLILPSPTTAGNPVETIFSLNPPAWSLFFELVVNLVYALTCRWLSTRVLVALLVPLGLCLVAVGWHYGTLSVGNAWTTVLAGFPRSAFPFFLGVLLQRQAGHAFRLPSGWTWVVAACLGLALLVDPGASRTVHDLLLVFLLFPVLLLLCTAIDAQGLSRSLARLAGEASYGAYILHVGILGVLLSATKRALPDFPGSAFSGPAFLAGIVLFALTVTRVYDRPVRTWLNRQYRRPAPVPSVPRAHVP